MAAGFVLTETVVEWIQTAFACTNLFFFSVKYNRFQQAQVKLRASCGQDFKLRIRIVACATVLIREWFWFVSSFDTHIVSRNYSDSRFKILTAAPSQFHMSLSEAVYTSRKKQICAGKSSSYSLYNCFGKNKACCPPPPPPPPRGIDCVSPYYCAISLKCISPYCTVHFSLLHLVLKRSCSPYIKPDRDHN